MVKHRLHDMRELRRRTVFRIVGDATGAIEPTFESCRAASFGFFRRGRRG
jgi:hypothetical protein